MMLCVKLFYFRKLKEEVAYAFCMLHLTHIFMKITYNLHVYMNVKILNTCVHTGYQSILTDYPHQYIKGGQQETEKLASNSKQFTHLKSMNWPPVKDFTHPKSMNWPPVKDFIMVSKFIPRYDASAINV